MHIVMFSMTPLFANRSMGGAQKQLKKVAVHLAEQGHRVTLLCTRRADAWKSFQWHENAQIIPIYDFKQPFPEPYDVPPFQVANAIQDTADVLAHADVFYSHDGGLIFPYIYQDIPAVISLRSVRFPETIQAGFLFQGDALILPSEHTANVWRHTAGRFFPQMHERVQVIPNGLDFTVYRPTDYAALAARLGVDPARHAIVLYPHRPEENKGIRQTFAIARDLVQTHGLTHLRLLIPRWIDTGLSPEVRAFYKSLRQEVVTYGLSEHVVFHDWITDDEMPAYYSLGGVTLAVGNYVETFGNTPYESMACGTPVVAARVGPYRTMLPAASLVDYGDITTAATRAAAILKGQTRVSAAALAWLQETFDQAAMVERYTALITGAQKQPPLTYCPVPLTDETLFQLAPWCVVQAQGVYHDFRGETLTAAEDVSLLTQAYFAPLARWNGYTGQVDALYRAGYLVPLMNPSSSGS